MQHPLLQSQLGVFIECMKYPNCTQYNMPTVTPLDEDVDIDRVENAFRVIYHSRVAWRLRFGIDSEGQPYQCEDATRELRCMRRRMTEAELHEYIGRGFCRPFDILGTEPLIRVEIVETCQRAYLLLDIHHLVMDGVSYIAHFAHREFSQAYSEGTLEAETYTVLDAADEEHATLHSADYAEARDYHHETYQSIDFATLSPRPDNPLGSMIRLSHKVDRREIDEWCSAKGIAPNLLFQAAFSYTVSVILREERIAYTTISHGRFGRHWRNIYGMFSRQIPVMSEVRDEDTVTDYIRSHRRQLTTSIRHAAYPITALCHDLGKGTGICFNFQAAGGMQESIMIGEKEYPFHEPDRDTLTDDIIVFVFPEKEKYEIRVESSSAMNTHETMQTLARAIAVTLKKMMLHPDAPVKSLSIVSDEEQQRLRDMGTGKRLAYDREKTIIDMFRAQASRTPDATAVVFRGRRYTYAELDDITDRIAVRLHRDHGVRTEQTVGVLIERSERMVIYPLAIMKAGAAYMPLDPSLPEDRLMYMCQDAGLNLIITDEGLAAKVLPAFAGEVIEPSRLEASGKAYAEDRAALPKALPANKFVILYTSGSTGRPKGVVLEHHGIRNFCAWYTHEYAMTEADNTIAYASFGFDAHMMDIYPALTVGATVHIIPQEMRKDIHALNEYMEANSITIAFMTTQLGYLFATTVENRSLRLLSVSGEKLMPLRKPQYHLYNAGAPTECTIYAFNYHITEEYYERPIIGTPIANVSIHVVDTNLHPMPQGIAGEMVICGEGVGRGYLNLPEQNAARFITLDGARAYRTGDLCRWNSEGQLEYIGRMDNQVKLRGFRIEPGEIESAALKVGGIGQAAAIVRNEQIVLYYTDEYPLNEKKMSASLSSTLPDYMMPSTYVQLDAMPLNANGKIDRKALPDAGQTSGTPILPATRDEQQVHDLVLKVLEDTRHGSVPSISVTANLISLGMSSISAMRLSMMLSRRLGRSVSMSQLLAAPTIREIASNLQCTADSTLGRQRTAQTYYPLTDNQVGIYLDWEKHRDALQYNIPSVLKLGGYDAEKVRKAVESVVAAHPYLQARLTMVDGEVVLARHDGHSFACPVTALDEAPDTAYFQSVVRPFNLLGDRLFRFAIYTYRDDTYLFRDIHHIINDGISDARLTEQILMAYRGEEIATEGYSAYDRALEEQEMKTSEAYIAAKEYYTKLLAGMENTVYPLSSQCATGQAAESAGTGHAGYVRMSLQKQCIESHCARLGVTPGNYLLTVFMEVLRRVTRTERVMIATVNNGREHAAMQDIQGFFVRTLPVVSAGSVADVQRQLIDNISHECYPLTEMAHDLGVRPEIMYAYEGELADQSGRLADGVTLIPLALDTVKVPLTLYVNPGTHDYELVTEYDDARYSEQDMQTLLNRIVTLARNYAAVRDDATPLQACPMGDGEEVDPLVPCLPQSPAVMSCEMSSQCEPEVFVAPSSKDEQDVLSLVEQLLGTSPVSVTDNLISLGLSSIAAMRLSVSLVLKLGKHIGMSELMDCPSVRSIAGRMQDATDSSRGRIRARQEYYPLTCNQTGIYLDWEQHREGLQYNVPSVLRFGHCDAARLKGAVERAVAAHPYLQARLARVNGEVMLRRQEEERFTCPVTALDSAPDVAFFQGKVRPFNLQSDPLCRLAIYTYNDEAYLLKDIHHIINDGISDTRLNEDILKAYRGETLVAETYSAYDYALEEREAKGTSAYRAAEEYFRTLLAGTECTVYPRSQRSEQGTDAANHGSGHASHVSMALRRRKVEGRCSCLSVTPSSYLLTVFMEVLRRVTRTERVMITTVSSGREHAAMQDIQGFFVRTLPVVSADSAGEVQRQLMESISHECYPLTEMVQTLGIHPEIMYAYEGGLLDEEIIRKTNDVSLIPLSVDTVKVPLTLTVNPGSEDYELDIEYDEALYEEEEDMRTLLHSIIVLAENHAKDASVPLQDCPMLMEEEELRLIELGTGERLDYDRSKTFKDLFREQAAKTPAAVAVVDYCSQLTYRELDEASDEYARTVTPGTFVCLEMPRVKEFVVAVLGIWKAGAAYVPIDTEYPEERKRLMREECDSKPLPSPDVAYMIYTSGSTGKPKGVMIQHSALMNFIQSTSREWHITDRSRISCHSSFAFDASVDDLYSVLTVGGTLYIIPEDVRRDITLTHDYIIRNGINGGSYSTQFAQLLLQQYPHLPVEYLVLGGEKMTRRLPCDCRLINAYGPTECTVDATYYCLEAGKEYSEIPIGRPLANLNCYIIDRQDNLMPQGMVGELCIAGAQLALGYYNNPELTSERFVEITINGKTERIYKTGDLCRWNREGQLEYIGRIDNQVKLRGFRIELGEIESAAMQTDGISQAVAVVRNEQIVLYYTGEDKFDEKKLSASLPDYMVPSVYVHLEVMPLTPNEKIDRKALPEPEYKPENIVLPATKDEQDVQGVVEDMMGISPVSVTANLISLGMSSITAMRLAMRMAQQSGKVISMSQLMASPTIRDIAAGMTDTADDNAGRVRREQVYYPLMDGQMGIYLDWEQHRDALQYNVPTVQTVRGCDARRLQTAVGRVVAAHPYLFARLAYVDGEVRLKRTEPEGCVCTLTRLEEEPDEAFFQGLVRPFDLFGDRLFRIAIYTYGENAYLFRDTHHIITDGVSEARLRAEIRAAYNGDDIEGETYSAYDRVLEEMEMKGSTAYVEAADYFRTLLSGTECTQYPLSTENLGKGKARHIRLRLGKQSIEGRCARLGVTPSNYMLTVFMEVLRRTTWTEKVLITTVSSGREHAAMQDIQGFFVKTLPVVSADSVADVQRQLIGSICHECYPFVEMVNSLGLRPEVMYVYEDELAETGCEADMDATMMELRLEKVKVPLTLTVTPDGADYELVIEYDDARYCEQDMQTLLDCIVVLAQNYAAVTDDGITLQECPMLTETEQQRLRDMGTGERLAYDREKTIIDMFRAQASKTPDATAVVFRGRRYTYAELDDITDRIAVRLHRDHGVRPEQTVGVLIERSERMVIYPLAIMKAGAAYMPLDPSLPEDRLMYMCQDAGLNLIITDEGLAAKVLPAFAGEVIEPSRLEAHGEASAEERAALPKALPANKFVILYTSGSTGRPKGVVLEHHGIRNFCAWYTHEYAMTEADSTIAYASFGFDAHMMDIYPALTVGATVHIIPQEMRKDIHALNEYMEANSITIAFMTTQLGYLFATTVENRSLRLLSVSGEKLMPLRKPRYRLYNAGAPTECTIYAFNYHITEEYYERPIIGTPIANVSIHVVDTNLHPVPQGIAGEMVICGEGVGRGYLNLPEQNAARFITLDGARAYRTGDLCRWNSEGQLEYIGRMDNQVKLRGFRIEPGEIESAALKVGGIGQAAAIVRNEQIVLYYTGEYPLNEKKLSASLSSTLPDYMLPCTYVQLDAMPLNANGKIDRKALSGTVHDGVEDYVAPANRLEKMLCRFVAEVLGIERIGVTDSLKSHGMTSIRAMRLSTLLRREDIKVNMGIIVRSDTILALCEQIWKGIDDGSAGFWLGERDTNKPTVVVCCGVISEGVITKHICQWMGRMNVYVLRPVFSAWSDVDSLSHEQIVNRLIAQIKQDVQHGVTCLMGFSYGGELAYCLAERWNACCGEMPSVLMGDSYLLPYATVDGMGEADDTDCFSLRLIMKFLSSRERLHIGAYGGKVTLLSALRNAPDRERNEARWREVNPDVYIVPIDDTHQHLYESPDPSLISFV